MGMAWVQSLKPKSRDPMSDGGKRVTRALISLSKSGSDEVVIREFDLLTCDFVSNDSFSLQEMRRTRAYYKSRDVLLIASDFGPNTMTKVGYPRTIREWSRGDDIKNAPVVFEGEESDVAVTAYVHDERERLGGIYEVRVRMITSLASKFWVRKVKFVHLLRDDDPLGEDAGPFKELPLPEDSEIDFIGNLLVITLKSDWSPEDGKLFNQGSIVCVNAHKFIKYGPTDRIYHVLFQSQDRVSCEDYIVTKEFVVLSIVDNMASKLEFHKLEKDANKLRLVGMDSIPQIRTVNIQAVDPYGGNQFWLTSTGYTQPSTLFLADASKMDSHDKKVIHRTGPEGYIDRKLRALTSHFDSSDFEVKRQFATSKDGTIVPFVVINHKSLTPTKKNPTLLYGFGSFGVSICPQYAACTGVAWLERGCVYVEAVVRGGGEFGDIWHENGKRDCKSRSLEDFIAVAEDLIASNVCTSKTLGVRGGGSGSVLVANAYIARPDLFGAVHCHSPLLDMKRYKDMGYSESWLQEFGDPDTDEWEEFMNKFSPYHNIDESVKKYPPLLLTTIANDPSIHPGHARKFSKKLWDRGLAGKKKWPAFYFESIGEGSTSLEAKQYAYITVLAHDFLFRKLSRSK